MKTSRAQCIAHWNNQGITLYPSKVYDANGCFSGSTIEINQQMYLYYTAIRYRSQNIHKLGINDFITSQSMLISPAFKENEIGHPTHTRDPKVWKYQDSYNMVLASKYFDENNKPNGQLLFYRSPDATNWYYQNNYRGIKVGDTWECPDIFTTDNQTMLIMSPERTNQEGYPSPLKLLLLTLTTKPVSCKNQSRLA